MSDSLPHFYWKMRLKLTSLKSILSLRWQNYRLCSSRSKSVSLLERYIFFNPRPEALSYHCPHCKKRIWDVPTILTYFRSSPPQLLLKKGILKTCSKFKGENPCRSVISVKLQSNFIEITLRHGCSPVNFLHIFRIYFPKNISGGLLLPFMTNAPILYPLRAEMG